MKHRVEIIVYLVGVAILGVALGMQSVREPFEFAMVIAYLVVLRALVWWLRHRSSSTKETK